jgi:arylamine N-acetyltransferase
MADDPLMPPPSDSPVLRDYLRHFGIRASPTRETLVEVASAFARLPYENLTKIIRSDEAVLSSEKRRSPAEVWADYRRWGSGGTCFSLTAALLHLVRALGWQAEPILADRRYGENTHCAIVVQIDGRPHIIDPGYLIVDPLPLPRDGEVVLAGRVNDRILTVRDEGRRIDLATRQQGGTKYRLTFKTEPVAASDFLKAWDASFDFDSDRYPVLASVSGDQQLYLQKNQLYRKDRDASQRTELAGDDLAKHIAREFGIAPEIAAKALAILKRRGETFAAPGVAGQA